MEKFNKIQNQKNKTTTSARNNNIPALKTNNKLAANFSINKINNSNRNRDVLRPSVNGKYNLNFIDWNNEWERVSEIETKIDNCEEISDKEEEDRVRSHMVHDRMLNSPGVSVTNFLLVANVDKTKECYICLKNFSLGIKVRKLPCNHLFCEVCLIPWFKSNCVCPTCKYKLKSEKEYDDNF